jgi:tetratricopeptide (TPR) repeat protein
MKLLRLSLVTGMLGIGISTFGIQPSHAQQPQRIEPVNIGATAIQATPAEAEAIRQKRLQRDTEVALTLDLLKSNKVQEAMSAFKRAIAIDPIKIPYDKIGDALEANGKTEDAIWVYRQSIYHHQNRDWVENGKSLAQEVKRATGEHAVGSRNIAPDVLMRYALLLSKTGRYAEACQVYEWGMEPLHVWQTDERDLELNMTATTFNKTRFEAMALTVYGRYNTGILVDGKKIGRDEEAIAAYQKALRLRPNYALAYYYLGQAFENKRQKQEAKAAYRKAADLATGELAQRIKSELR